MNLIETSITRPIAVISAVLMTVLFGLLALTNIPVQLAPDVRTPVIIVETVWPGAAPAEIEREIVNEQEEALKGLEGLDNMISVSQRSRGEITLEFRVGSNMDKALLLVANRLDRVSGYPLEADEPTLKTSGAEDNPIAWVVIKRLPGNDTPLHEYGDFIEDFVKPGVERVPGINRMQPYGGVERELWIIIDPQRMAQYRLTVAQVVARIQAANIALSAGNIDEGKRQYTIRTDGELRTPEDVGAVLLRSERDAATGGASRVTLADIAEIRFGYPDPGAKIRHLGEPAIAFNAQRETGANVIETMDQLQLTLDDLNENLLKPQGLELVQVYNETDYIHSAISLVQQNLMIGGLLAAFMLMLFLRSLGATFVISMAIPVSIVGSFVAMAALGRSINVISLAGLAFAVGMVVDAAIVVLENIYRLRSQGIKPSTAAYRGASEVWGAIFVSALTTVMVFIPILVMELEVGQLFRDIAVAISVAVMLSLLVSVTVIPALAKKFLSGDVTNLHEKRRIPGVDHFARGFSNAVVGFTQKTVHNSGLALLVVVAVSAASILTTVTLKPELEYLPNGNRNLVFGIILPPPGYNLETTTQIGIDVENAVSPLWLTDEQRANGDNGAEPGKPPKIDNFFFVSLGSLAFVGASSAEPTRAGELLGPLSGPVFAEPGTFGVMQQYPIFGRGIGGSRQIDLNISGADLEQVVAVAQQAAGLVAQNLPFGEGNFMRPDPGLELGAPEVRVIPDRQRLADAGVSATDLALSIDTFNDGLRAAEVTVEGKRINLMLKGNADSLQTTQQVSYLPVVVDNGQILPVNALAEVLNTAGPTAIRHLERTRTITLIITPRKELSLEKALNVIETQVIAPLQENAQSGIQISVSGTADKLDETWNAMKWQLFVAVIIVYLVMAVLFESFLYPLVILVAVPLALAGAVVGLDALNDFTQFKAAFNSLLSLLHVPNIEFEAFSGTPQNLDMLTMLGFVILIGIVVNNAILIVHQALHHMREDAMNGQDAIVEATRNRLRPIFMSTLTSVLGMMPLVLFPGAGSELYRGLGSVVLGGLSLSAILTLLIVPPMLSLFLGAKESLGQTESV